MNTARIISRYAGDDGTITITSAQLLSELLDAYGKGRIRGIDDMKDALTARHPKKPRHEKLGVYTVGRSTLV